MGCNSAQEKAAGDVDARAAAHKTLNPTPYLTGCSCAQEKAACDVDARAAAHKVRRLKRKSADLEPSATITVTASASHAGELAPRCASLNPNPKSLD